MNIIQRYSFLRPVAEAVERAGGRLCLVGGAVRDIFLQARSFTGEGEEGPDLDMVAFGLRLEDILAALEPFGQTRSIGRRTTREHAKERSLAHARFAGKQLEISPGRRLKPGVDVEACGTAVPQAVEFSALAGPLDDALIRDFTINAVYYDPLREELQDPLGGLEDMQSGRLALCHPMTFVLDPLRLMRAFGLISRYGLRPAQSLVQAAGGDRYLLADVPRDRFWPEWRKWAQGRHPHLGLKFLEESELLECWPDLAALRGVRQNPRFHPEGDAWRHTVLVVEAMAGLELPPECDRLVLTLAALLHDIGKPSVTEYVEGRWISHGHALAGSALAARFMKEDMRAPARVIRAVLKLVERHMDLAFRDVTPRMIRRLARRLAPECNLAEFWAVGYSDWNGRGPSMRYFPLSLEQFLEPLKGAVNLPTLIMGRDVLAAFPELIQPGPELGELLAEVEEAADGGRVTTREEALALAGKLLRQQGHGLRRADGNVCEPRENKGRADMDGEMP